jgi:hypothetical protein
MSRPSKIDYPNASHHLMAQTPDANLSRFMRLLNGISADPDIQELEFHVIQIREALSQNRE